MKLQLAKGTRDLPVEEELARLEAIESLRNIFERHGFNPIQTPIVERQDVLSAKYAGGEEILKEMYKLKDQGGRPLALRYDLTVPFARFIGINPNLKMPFKRYQIGEVFRDGPIKLGRYRQFTQCDADIVGVKSMLAEVELLHLAERAFKTFNLPVTLKVNNVKVLKGIMDKVMVDDKKQAGIILTIDKLEKVGKEEVKKELKDKGLAKKQVEELLRLVLMKGTANQKLKKLEKELPGNEGLEELKEIFAHNKIVEFDPALARGLSYYTGTIYEGFLKKSEIRNSVCSGGRYDEMMGKLLGTSRSFHAVGLSFGLDVILDGLREKKKLPRKSVVKVYIIPIKTEKKAMKLAMDLRKEGVNVDMDINGKSISKGLDYANSFEIPYTIILGSDEVKKKKYKLKDMKTGKETLLNFPSLVKKLQ